MRWLEATVMTAGKKRRRGGRACLPERLRDVYLHPEQLEPDGPSWLLHCWTAKAGWPAAKAVPAMWDGALQLDAR
jgi:hypothetical protein